MTHRIEQRGHSGAGATFEVQGLLDRAAVEELRVAVEATIERGGAARIVLCAGTEVDRACLPALCRLRAQVVAESPYLARWIADGTSR